MIRRLLLTGMMLATLACAPLLTPIPPSPVRTLPLGLNAGFHSPLPASVVQTYCGTTIRTPQLSVEGLTAYYASLAPCPSMRTLVLVEAPDAPLVHALATALHPGDFVEAGNELELPPYELSVPQYADFIRAACVPAMVTGGVYTLNDDTKTRMLAAHAACPSARLGLHLYQPLTVADAQWLAALPVHVLVTETGFPTRCDPARDLMQRAFLLDMQSILSTIPTIDQMIIYQHTIGPTCSDLDTFGIAGHSAQDLLTHAP